MKKFVMYLIVVVFITSCGNNELEPTPADCSISTIIITTEITKSRCTQSDGVINISASGGQGVLLYSIDAGVTFQESSTFSDLAVGIYDIVVKDVNNCENSVEVSLDDVGDLKITVESQNNTLCGLNEGSILVSATGGSGNLQFQLNNDDPQSLPSFEGLSAGSYTIHAIDSATGCQAVVDVVISETNKINVNIVTDAAAGCGTSNGKITVSATGGSGDLSYSIDNGSFGASNVFENLFIGAHAVQVRDENGCQSSETFTLTSGVSYAGTVQSIISGNCAISGCHVSGTGRVVLSNLGNVQSNASSIRSRTQSGNMPRNGTLTADEIALIACWVDDGALDN